MTSTSRRFDIVRARARAFSTRLSASEADHGSSKPSHRRRRQLLDARLAGAREERLPPAADHRPRPRRDARCGREGGDQGPGGRRARRRLRRRAQARQHDRLLRHAPSRRRDRSRLQGLVLRLLRERRAQPHANGPARARRALPLSPPVHRATDEGLRHRAAFAGQAHPQPVLSDGRGVRGRDRAHHEPRAARAGARRRRADPDRRALLLGVPRGSALGGARHQHARRRRGRAVEPARVLWQPLRQAVVGRQLPLSVPGDPRGTDPSDHARVRPPGQRGPAALQGIRRAVHARPRRRRREDSRRRDTRDRGRADPRGARDSSGRSALGEPGLRSPPSSPRGRLPQARRHGGGGAARPARAPGMTNPLREALATGRFCYVVELVASALTREARLLEAASGLARIPAVVAGSVTSYAGGAMGHDPLRVAAAARARGLTPNIHLTCVSQDRLGLAKSLDDMHALSLENVFALTGDYPGAGDQPPVFDLDSVQLVRLIDERRRGGIPFHVAVAVSPFKYTEADCVYQYIKLEKKIADGADVAITQVGWDARKFEELKRYLDERGLRTPLLGNVYVLGPKTAERMATGRPPGCWVSPELLAAVRAESLAKDGGRLARLERVARTVAVLRGLGYAGAYIGGTHDAAHLAWIIRRADELAPGWEALAAELRYGAAGGFYLATSREPLRSGARAAPAPPWAHLLPRLLHPRRRGVPLPPRTP